MWRRCQRLFVAMAMMCTLLYDAAAQTPLAPDDEELPYMILAEDAGKEAFVVDSLFYLRSLPIIFPASKSTIDTCDAELLGFIHRVLPLLDDKRVGSVRVRVRSASSPEGPLWLNRQLSQDRREALLQLFGQHGIQRSQIEADVVEEEYELLAFFMRQAGDPDALRVTQMVHQHRDDTAQLKQLLMEADHGKLWKRLLQEYFPRLRASRFLILLPEASSSDMVDLSYLHVAHLPAQPIETSLPSPIPLAPAAISTEGMLASSVVTAPGARREFLSVKTNLLEWGAYVPHYGWCPLPNIALEFYPRHGHFTYGLLLDCPWWSGTTENHKYFQARNYTVESRYYFRSGDRAKRPAGQGAAFRGWFLSAYANACLYGIGWSDKKKDRNHGTLDGHGWQGEGIGGGLGVGYVLPLSKDQHWRLELTANLGVFATKYDPYVYGCPVENIKDGLYYYDYRGDADLFKKREYKLTWLGPTRVSVNLSYDLLYRKNHRKGLSLRKSEPTCNR